MKTLLNTTKKNIPVLKKNGGAFMLAPRKKITIDPSVLDLGSLPAGVVLK